MMKPPKNFTAISPDQTFQMSKEALPPTKQTERLMELLWSPMIKDNPYAFVMAVYPWGQEKTPLANQKGPRSWQKEELLSIAAHIKENKRLVAAGKDPKVYKLAVSSGRGVGKSALVAWVTHWMMSCHIGSTTILTANTDSQLTNKTFGEIGIWFTLAINSYWFERVQKGVMPAPWFAEAMKKQLKIDNQYYYAKGELWNEDSPDAFAGAHNMIGMLLIMDEASGVPKPIWTVSEGFFTEKSVYRFWLNFSNPRSNTGAFHECFTLHRDYWRTRKIDARTVEGLDRAVYDEIIAKHGEDSREARVEVRGEFPAQGDRQYISRSVVADACVRQLDKLDDYAPLVMGVDPARYGDDSTVIRFRKGRDARSYPPVVMKGASNMEVANKCAALIEEFNPDAVFIDSGAGSGIIDRLKELGFHVFEVIFGSSPEDPKYFDHRSELWARMAEWLSGSMIGNERDEDKKLVEDLVGPEYEIMGREDKIKLESKEKMKKRGLPSPDNADALAVTFHAKVARRDWNAARKSPHRAARKAKGVGSDVDFT